MKTNRTTKKAAKAPSLYAYSVTDAKAENQSAYWTRIGAYFAHEDGEGGTLLLDAIPINGRIVLRTPKTDE